MNIINIIYYVASITSVILYVMSAQFKKKKDILSLQIGSSISYLLVYLTKGMWSGVASEILVSTKNLVFIKQEKKYKTIPLYSLIIFLALLIIASIICYQGPLSLLPLVINILLFIATYFSPKVIRYVMLLTGILWCIYNLYGGAYIICIGNLLEIGSSIISIVRFKKTR